MEELKMETRQRIIYLLLFVVMISTGYATDLKVSYLSAEHVYIEGGRSEGIRIGTILVIKKEGKKIAELEVIYVSEHSASCKIISSQGMIEPGDKAEILSNAAIPAIVATASEQRERLTPGDENSKAEKSRTRIRGSFSLQWYHFEDKSGKNYHFDQPAIRFSLKAKNLWARQFHLDLKMRARYHDRHGRSSTLVPATDWRNRIYRLMIAYSDPDKPLQFAAGRISSTFISGVGYLDGIQLQHQLSRIISWGLFGGFQPEYLESEFQTDLKKFGIFLKYLNGSRDTFRSQISISATGTYHGSTVSREFLYLQSSFSKGSLWNIYQSLELDLNRDWRKEKTDQTLSISSIYLSGNLQINQMTSLQLTYDNRKNYYTYQYVSLADSLFDDAFRHGLRLNLNFRFQKKYRLNISGGIRKRKDDSRLTYSYHAGGSINNFIFNRVFLTGRVGAYSNLYTRGFNFTLQLQQRFYQGHSLAILFGGQQYHLRQKNDAYRNQWMRFNTQIELPWRLYFSGYYEYDFGDDLEGQRIFAEIGYRW